MSSARTRVAIVDDDESVRKALRRLLCARELDADVYASGEDFIRSLNAQLPDCVVLDLHMPGMTGLDVQQHLAKSDIPVPVVIITGHDQPGGRARCLSAGAIAYLCKPLDDKILLQAILEAIGRGKIGQDSAAGIAASDRP
jgi:FixJ family two-component response regulator